VGDRIAGWEPAIYSCLLVFAALVITGDVARARTASG
jgi:hypothetical protein